MVRTKCDPGPGDRAIVAARKVTRVPAHAIDDAAALAVLRRHQVGVGREVESAVAVMVGRRAEPAPVGGKT